MRDDGELFLWSRRNEGAGITAGTAAAAGTGNRTGEHVVEEMIK
jgi:hypothetical protein